MRVHLVAGARPNFMKVGPLCRELADRPWCEPCFVHTGQHYDTAMADVFVEALLPPPAVEVGVGSGTHAEQTAAALVGYERFLGRDRPDLTVVVGDVNSTLAAVLATVKGEVPRGAP